jgi:hypothetical protein
VDELQAAGADAHGAEIAVQSDVVLADQYGSVSVDRLDIHGVPIVAPVGDRHVPDPGFAVDRNACPAGIARPLVSIADATPIRHVATSAGYLPGGVADALAVIHTPRVNHAILRCIGPDAGVATAAWCSLRNRTDCPAILGQLLGPQLLLQGLYIVLPGYPKLHLL